MLSCRFRRLLIGAACAFSISVAWSANEPAMDIWEFQIEGNSVLEAQAPEQAVQAHLGPGRSMKDVEAARDALEQADQKAGYLSVLVDIPEQRVEEGIVRLAVIEGRVGTLYVSGSRYHDQGYIRQRVTELAPGGVPNFNTVQQQLAMVNRSEDRRVQPVLKPGRLPGTVDIDLQVSDSLPAGGSVEVNNQHAAGTTPTRVLASAHYDNLHQKDQALSLTLQTAPEKPAESEVGVLNYSVPFDGDTLATNVVVSNSDVDTLGGTEVLGKGFTLGLRWQHPVVLDTGWWSFSAGFDYKSLRQRTQFGLKSVETRRQAEAQFEPAAIDRLELPDPGLVANASIDAGEAGHADKRHDSPENATVRRTIVKNA